MLSVISSIFILSGALFMCISALGLWRLKGLYLKLHATTKAGTLGCGLILFGVGIHIKSLHRFTEIILLIIFIAITAPLSAHLIGKLYYLRSNRRHKTIRLDGDN